MLRIFGFEAGDIFMSLRSAFLICALVLIGLSATVHAQEAPTAASAQEAAAKAEVSANNAWMLTSAALVLFMTAPGLAMFYSGLVRRKNVLGVMMQCLFLMGLMTVVWGLWGFSLSFANGVSESEDGFTGNPYIGNSDFMFMRNITLAIDEETGETVAPSNFIDAPDLTFMVFQGMFFIITPALICGAFAERMKFSTMVIFMVLWGTLVYCPLCHWVWASGILAHGSPAAWKYCGAMDFAGGTVVHISSGVSALIVAILIGKRLGFGTEDMRPHNMTYTALGAAMLWVGWFGFNAGSAGAANASAANAFVVTHFSAAAGAVTWALVEWIARGKPSILGTASGAVAGLVCITPASGFVQPMPALIMGAIAGVGCYVACSSVKGALGYDDSLDAFGVHGVGGTIGAILTGIFASSAVGGTDGLWYDRTAAGVEVVVGQIGASVVTIVYAAVVTFILVKILDVTIGLRVPQESEIQGLDLAEHGEEGYIFN